MLPACLALFSMACGGSDVVVDQARETSDPSDGGAEVLQAPDFEVELAPGQDPEEVLVAPTPTSPPAPENAIGVLCPSVQAVIAGAAVEADLAAIASATPSEWATLLTGLDDPVGRGSDVAIAELDRWLYETCSFPLFATIDQLATGCDDAACRGERIDKELGGLCVDDQGSEPARYRLLSCVSGLPVDG